MVPLCYNCVLNYGLDVVGPEMTMDFWFHKVEPMFGERAAHRQPTALFGTVKNSPDCSWTKMVHVKFLMCCCLT